MQKTHWLLSAELPQTFLKATGVSVLTIQIGNRQVRHAVSIVPQLHSPFLVGADLLVRLGTQLDTVNQVLWSQAKAAGPSFITEPDNMASGQTIPQACQVLNEVDVTIPARTAGVPIRLIICKGQKLPVSQAFFQPSPRFGEPSLSVCGTPLLEVNNRTTYLLVQNLSHAPVQVPIKQPLGVLIDSSFHDFELTIPVIGELPPSLVRDNQFGNLLLTFPTKMIMVTRHETLQNEAICGTALSSEGNMVVYALAAKPEETTSRGDTACSPSKEPYSGFESEVEQQLLRADALTTDEQR